MHLSNAIIKITNLRLRTFIGFNPEEQEKQQDIIVNVEIHYPADKACSLDHIDDALDYKAITKKIIQFVEDGRFMLLEKLVKEVLDICSSHEWVTYSKVRIDKPHALRFADSVSLTMDYSQQALTKGAN
jgi:D-erythro-7,8-dihydroneopterin triphosphate epimerase